MREACEVEPEGFEAEKELIARRRAKAGIDRNQEACGLALSGGGIRSATFSLGVLRGMAKAGALRRFDYLSTVSGGGYVGAAWGRLYGKQADARKVEASVADDGSLFLWWLRNNGRYLTPRGAKDTGIAIATMSRGWFLSFAYALLATFLLAAIVLLPHGAVWGMPDSMLWPPWQTALPTIWWLAALIPLAMAVTWAYVYDTNVLVDRDRHIKVLGLASLFLAGIIICAVLLEPRLEPSLSSYVPDPWVSSIILLAIVTVLIWNAILRRFWPDVAPSDPNRLAKGRLILTGALRSTLLICLLLVAAGCVDALCWYLFASAQIDQSSLLGGISGLTALLFAIIGAIRAVIPTLQAKSEQDWIRNIDWLRVANLLGYVTMFLMVLLCSLALTFLAFDTPGHPDEATVSEFRPLWVLLGVATVLTVMLWKTGAHLEALNLGSLHYFYRARLARTYVSLGNHNRFGKEGALAEASRESISRLKRINDVVQGDDVPLDRYRPDSYGGPLHLINCCINQTRDDRTGNYNADRRGISLAVGPCGVETGAQQPAWHEKPEKASTLAAWAAMSGAAVGTGMGLYTRRGVAALLYLSGLRLGYWMESMLPDVRHSRRWKQFPRVCAWIAEFFASFPGMRSAYWYVTDGGHFDNTGVYALLKRKLPIIVLIDAAADPEYLFGDVENLVRKAKIDLDADVDFLDPATLPHEHVDTSRFGTPYSITSEAGSAFLLVARIRYAGSSAPEGLMLIVKPRRTVGMSLDVVGYADRHPAFPQESTLNQFFSEEQWESYHSLGVTLGQALTPKFLLSLSALARHAKPISGESNIAARCATSASTAEGKSIPVLRAPDERRARVRATLRKSLGVGVSVSVVIALWQALQVHRNDSAATRTRNQELLAKLAAEFDKPCISPGMLAANLAVLRTVTHSIGPSIHEIRMLASQVDDFCPGGFPWCAASYFPAAVYQGVAPDSPIRAWYWSPRKQPVWQAQSEWRACREKRDRYLTASNVVVLDGPQSQGPSSTDASPNGGVSDRANVAEPMSGSERARPAEASGGCPKEPVEDNARQIQAACGIVPGVRSLYPHVYQPKDLSSCALNQMLRSVKEAGVRVHPTEDVSVTDERRDKPVRLRWDRPTVLYSVPGDKECAEAIAMAYPAGRAVSRALPPHIAGRARTMEFWLPPAQ